LSTACELAIGILHADYFTASVALMCPNSFWVKVACRTDITVVMVVVVVVVAILVI
jgi:hypothetical protein